MKYLSTRDGLEFEDLWYDADGDGTYAYVKVDTGEYIPVSQIDQELIVKSAASGAIKRAVDAGWLTEEADYDDTTTVDETNLAEVYLVTATTTTTLSLLSSVGLKGRTYYIKKMDSGINPVVILASLTQTIDGASTYTLTTQYDFVQILSDDADWQIISTAEEAEIAAHAALTGGTHGVCVTTTVAAISDVAVVSTEIAEVSATVVNHTTYLSEVTATVANIETYLSEATTTIDNHTTYISEVCATVNTHTDALVTVNTLIEEVSATVASLNIGTAGPLTLTFTCTPSVHVIYITRGIITGVTET